MNHQLDQVQSFLDKFQIETTQKPHYIEHELFIKRCSHILEELKELAYCYSFIYDRYNSEKWTNVNLQKAPLEEVLDALVDIQYLTLGTVLLHGMGNIFEEAFNLVHEANMKKVLTKQDNHKLGIAKPEGWVKPDLKGLIHGI